MKVLEYKRPTDLEEAFSLLNGQKNATVIAGGLFLRMQKRTIPLVIDLIDLELDFIEEEDGCFKIGSMVSLREIEVNGSLQKGLIDSVKQISGVGTRNLATIGGSVCGRYPFSDIDTALMALNAELVFYQTGKISMREFYENGLKEKDILLHIEIPKALKSATKFYKPVYTDFSLVNLSVANNSIAIGARPSRAICLENVDFKITAKEILKDVNFYDDFRASGDYRRVLAETLLDDILDEMED